MAWDDFDTLINDSGDHELDAFGQLCRDSSVATRCRFRLLCRRGQYWADPELGSRFYQIKTLKDAQRRCQDAAQEALKPLVDQGLVQAVAVGQVESYGQSGALVVPIDIELPEGQRLHLGRYLLGDRS